MEIDDNKVDNNRIIAGLISVAVIGLLSWTVLTTNQTQRDLAVLANKMENLQSLYSLAAGDRYTARNAAQDMALFESKINRIDERNKSLVDRIEYLEKEFRKNN